MVVKGRQVSTGMCCSVIQAPTRHWSQKAVRTFCSCLQLGPLEARVAVAGLAMPYVNLF